MQKSLAGSPLFLVYIALWDVARQIDDVVACLNQQRPPDPKSVASVRDTIKFVEDEITSGGIGLEGPVDSVFLSELLADMEQAFDIGDGISDADEWPAIRRVLKHKRDILNKWAGVVANAPLTVFRSAGQPSEQNKAKRPSKQR
jgi:hypothetical protein